MGNHYRLERIQLGREWDEFVQESQNGTVFSHSSFLKNIDKPAAVFYCYKKKEKRAGVAVVETDDGRSCCFHQFVIYNGILFCPPAHRQNRAQILSERFRITTCVAESLAELYKQVQIRLSPSFIDIRPFQWVNYGTQLPRYRYEIRYTSYVSVDDFAAARRPEETALFSECSSARRQGVRYAIRDGVITKEDAKPDLFVGFYKLTMERQGEAVEEVFLKNMKRLMVAMIDAGFGRMFVSYTQKGEPGSMAFFVLDNKRAHYLFGANDPALRDAHTGTAVLWDSFTELSKGDIKEVNLEGVNSPRRGWFKLSFGGDLRPYFQLTLTKKE